MSTRDKLDGLREILAFDNWPVLLLGRLFDRRAGFVIYRKSGMDILVDHGGGDENGTRYCLAGSMYRKYIATFLLPEPVRVLDLGAMGGGFPLLLRVMGVKVARAISVEMNPMTYLRLQLNLATNLGSSCVAVNAAVCALPDNSELRLNPNRGSTSDSIYSVRAEASAGYVSVPTTTLEALYANYFKDEIIDICKIDIEGAEYELFESCTDHVLRKIRYLIVEFHDDVRTPGAVEKLTRLGFDEIQVSGPENTDEKVRAFRGPGA